ncbi:putative GDSL-like lipase/acylhydrolase [Actinoplanes friuliensis DSM 7358]|uniref:Putative GDSL-like lipase/acylhydrolase n=1 Tax=Actinoplanes friuliensis DSM 7358 TaxID=1246995 RepID=U5VNT1_9ACTN|nr:putative GDSL-like lipase/acylhydrolase [Actinoplanes friuliensis DSM 7358]
MGARRLGIKAVTGLLAIGLIAGTGTSEAAKADPAATVKADDAKAATFTALRVMPLGDSITLGTGGPNRSSYRMDLAQRLLKGGLQINYVGSQASGTGTDIQHEGHGGWSIDELSEELDGWLSQSRPDVVLLHAGTNNLKQGDGPYATAGKLSALIDQIRAARPEARIFVAKIISARAPRELANGRTYNRLIPKLVAEKNDPLITLVDQSSVGGIDLHDLRHPNEFGYSKMAWNWYRAMSRVYGTSGDTGANPYRARTAYRCLGFKAVVDGETHHRTECRTWKLRTATVEIDGVKRRVRAWLTLRSVQKSYRVRVDGKLVKRTRTIEKWTGPGNLLNV